MGKKSKSNKPKFPFVSIVTPTFNRRPFIQSMFECYKHQTYPKERMEWIIIDDGTDKIKDLIEKSDIKEIKYFALNEKITLGKKRNMLHEKSKGDIIVYMDDDDYYPPTRVEHAVTMLKKSPKTLIAGCSKLFIYFKHIEQMYYFGPYKPTHATAATFAFRRELLKITKFNENASLAEEKEFLKDFTIPMVQLDPLHVILVFSHSHNTFNKQELLDQPPNQYCTKSDVTVDDFIKESALKSFYLNEIEPLLAEYDAGKPEMKPDVIQQTKELREKRKQLKQNSQTQLTGIKVKLENNTIKELTRSEVIHMIDMHKSEIKRLNAIIDELKKTNTIQQVSTS